MTRLIVSMTRPKRHLCVVGDSETLAKYVYPPSYVRLLILQRGSAFVKRWMEHLENHADLRYPDLNDLQDDS